MVLGSPKQRNLLPGVRHEEAVGYALDVFHRIMPAIGAVGVDLCFEPLAPNDTDFVNTCEQAADLVRQVGHPHFKLHMDVKAQSSERGTSVPELIRKYAKNAGHFHAQDVNLRGPGMGQVDFGPIMKALVESGYNGWVSVEVFDFSPGAEETARQSIACLKNALAKAAQALTSGAECGRSAVASGLRTPLGAHDAVPSGPRHELYDVDPSGLFGRAVADRGQADGTRRVTSPFEIKDSRPKNRRFSSRPFSQRT